MLYSLSQKAQKYENKLLFDICLLRVKEPFIEPVNFARLPKMVIVVKGNHVIDPIYLTYGVFQLKMWCFELVLWLGFWIFGLFIKLGVVLSSGNLCMINHLKLFWLQTASAASNEKCQNLKMFFTQNMPRMTAELEPSTFVWFHCDFLVISSIFSKSVAKIIKRLQKLKILLSGKLWDSIYWVICYQNEKKNLSKFEQKISQDKFEFWYFLPEAAEVKKVSSG